jgi:hypothetical protein
VVRYFRATSVAADIAPTALTTTTAATAAAVAAAALPDLSSGRDACSRRCRSRVSGRGADRCAGFTANTA